MCNESLTGVAAAPGVCAEGRNLSSRKSMNLTTNSGLLTCMKMRHCLHSSCSCGVKVFGGGSSGSVHMFLLACYHATQAITVPVCMATTLLPTFALADFLGEQP